MWGFSLTRAKDFYRSPGLVPQSDVVLVPRNLGIITFYRGESPEGKPGLWTRYYKQQKSERQSLFKDFPDYYNCGQAGVAFVVTELKGCKRVV